MLTGVYFKSEELFDDMVKPIVVVVCGGNMASLDLFETWKNSLKAWWFSYPLIDFQFWSWNLKEIIETKGLSEMSTDQLKQFVLNKQMEMHQDYVKEIKGIWLGKGLSTQDVDYVVALFEKFRFDVIRSFEHRIAAIFGSSFHPNNFERMLAIFDMWAMGIDLLPKDMNTTFEYLNGKFKDIDY